MKRIALSAVIAVLPITADAAVVGFIDDRAGFAAAVTGPLSLIGFEGLLGQNIAGVNLSGAVFTSPDGTSLDVVSEATTNAATYGGGVTDASTNTLTPTEGAALLSPGGASLVAGPDVTEADTLTVTFATPVAAFGVDVLFQSLDLAPGASIQAFTASGSTLFSAFIDDGNSLPGGSPAATIFAGLVSSESNIARVTIFDNDDDASFPDNNFGFDAVSFSAPAVIPLPAAGWMLAGGLAALTGLARRRG